MKRRIVSISKSTLLLVCLFAHFLDRSVSEEIEAGDDVELHCWSPSIAAITMLKWIRTDLKSDSFVFFFRGKRVYGNYQHESYRGRVKLKDPEMKDGDASVILQKVTINDAGTYECYVGHGGKTHLINTIHLTVVEPGDAAGHNGGGENKDEGNKDEGSKENDGGNTTVIGVVLPVVVVLLLVVGIVGFRIHKKIGRPVV